MTATLQSKINIPQDVLFRDVAGEAVVLNLTTGKYYGLDQVGTRIWSLLVEHGQIEPAYRAMLDEYEVTEDQLRQDIVNLVDRLASNGLVQIVEA